MLRTLSKLGLILLTACAGSQRLTAPGPAVTLPANPCGRWVVGADAAVHVQRTLVLAGGHDTEEVPRFVGDLLCQLGRHQPVVLALAWPRRLAGTLNLFVSGSKTAEAKLRAEAAATGSIALTRAMWNLLVQLRTWHDAALTLKLVPFGADPVSGDEAAQPEDSWERYTQTELLSALPRKDPDAAVVLWLELAEGGREANGGAAASLASTLSASGVQLLGFRLEPLTEADAPTAAPWSLDRRASIPGYDGIFRVGATTASGALEPPPRR